MGELILDRVDAGNDSLDGGRRDVKTRFVGRQTVSHSINACDRCPQSVTIGRRDPPGIANILIQIAELVLDTFDASRDRQYMLGSLFKQRRNFLFIVVLR